MAPDIPDTSENERGPRIFKVPTLDERKNGLQIRNTISKEKGHEITVVLPLELEKQLKEYCRLGDYKSLAKAVNEVLKDCETVQEIDAVLKMIDQYILSICQDIFREQENTSILTEACILSAQLFKELILLRSVDAITQDVKDKVAEVAPTE